MNKVELIKETDLLGKVWFKVKKNNETLKYFTDKEEQEAKNFYSKIEEALKNGYPKDEVIATVTF